MASATEFTTGITIIILAGGKSSRMGEDKGLISLYEKPMVEHVLDVAKKISNQIIIISNNANYGKFGFPVYRDTFKEKGPLAGIYEGLSKSSTEKNVVLSCDVPYIKTELLTFLIENSDNNDITIPVHGDRVHPLIGVYSKNCILVLEAQIKAGQLKVTDSFDNLVVNYVKVDQFDALMFKNINSKRDL